MFTEQLSDLLDYIDNLPGLVCDMNIHFDNPLQSLTKQTLTTLSLYNLVQVINKTSHKCGHIIDCVIVRPDDDMNKNYAVTDSLESGHYCIITSMFQSLTLVLTFPVFSSNILPTKYRNLELTLLLNIISQHLFLGQLLQLFLHLKKCHN